MVLLRRGHEDLPDLIGRCFPERANDFVLQSRPSRAPDSLSRESNSGIRSVKCRQQGKRSNVRRTQQLQSRSISFPSFHAPLVALAFVLAAMVASFVPEFFNDSQYYVQAGPLWLHGDVTFAGSLIGSRHLAVLAYLVPRLIFGESLHVISLTLAAINLAFNICVIALAASYLGRTRVSQFAAAVIMLVTFATPIWNSPLTDNLLVLAAAVGLVIRQLFCISTRSKTQYFGLLLLGITCGLFTGLRSEAAIVWVSCVATWALCSSPVEARAKRTIGIALSTVAFAAFTMAQPFLFVSWTGVSRPAQLTGLLLFYKPLTLYASADAGPASAVLAEWLKPPAGTDKTPITPMFYAAGRGDKEAGPEKTSRILFTAGLEVMKQRPAEVLQSTLSDIGVYLTAPVGRFVLDGRTTSERLAETRAQLKQIDELRVSSAQWLNEDSHWPVSALSNRPGAVPAWQDWLRNALPAQPIANLPGWLFSLLLAIGILIVVGLNRWSSPMAVSILVILCLIPLTAFSQGYVLRYWLPWHVLLLLTFPLEIARLLYDFWPLVQRRDSKRANKANLPPEPRL
jgi:hypothetical protein